MTDRTFEPKQLTAIPREFREEFRDSEKSVTERIRGYSELHPPRLKIVPGA